MNPILSFPKNLNVTLVDECTISDLGRARAEGVRRAHAPVIAFLEDHTIPDPRWAEEVCNAFRASPFIKAVSYAFLNGSPDTYFYRSAFMAEYGVLAHPIREGIAPAAVSNNIAYRRDVLMAVGPSLDALIEIDYFLHREMGKDFQVATAPRALLSHQTNRRLRDLIQGHFYYARLFAARRLLFERWRPPKRIAAGFAVPILVPLLRIKRLFQVLSTGPHVPSALAALPVILLLYLAGALGETWGLLHRKAASVENLIWLELSSERIGR
jgi:hypothetical protein